MATIQLKRKTSSGTGPLTGTSGTVKQGEPLIDLNGGNLYIAKADKTASSSSPLAASDYIEFANKANTETLINSKISALKLKGASQFDVGTTAGKIPVIDSDGKLKSSIIPQIAITDTFVVASQAAMLALSTAQVGDVAVRTDLNKSFILKADGYSTLANWQELLTPTDKVQSVNGKTGAVTIGCSDIGAATTTQLSNHASSDIHLTTTQKTKIADSKNYLIISGASKAVATSTSSTDITNNCIIGGLKLYTKIDTSYIQPIVNAYLGIDKTKVLTPSSTIDGGTY